MSKKQPEIIEVSLDKIVGGGQALGTLPDGRKLFVWGGLPGERAFVKLTKKKSNYAEGIVFDIITPSPDRIEPKDPDSFLSTSPWQIMSFEAEQRYKADLIDQAFELHGVVLPGQSSVYTDGREYHYRNKVEFSWYGQKDAISGVETLDLAFFRRGTKGKVPVKNSALLPTQTINLATSIRDKLQSAGVTARELKTLLIRSDADESCVWQLYVKDTPCDFADTLIEANLPAKGGEIIYSTPKSPASVITERLASTGDVVLKDTVLGVPFRYVAEGFFQVNIPVYEQALKDMKEWVGGSSTLDLYSGVGSIGLTIGGPGVTLIESNEHAVREMKRNIKELDINATPVLAASEQALDHITSDSLVIVDPPRAGLHPDVTKKLLEVRPPRIIYLSCNPTTQARDCALLLEKYTIKAHKGYNFFPRTPHIEHLVILEVSPSCTAKASIVE